MEPSSQFSVTRLTQGFCILSLVWIIGCVVPERSITIQVPIPPSEIKLPEPRTLAVQVKDVRGKDINVVGGIGYVSEEGEYKPIKSEESVRETVQTLVEGVFKNAGFTIISSEREASMRAEVKLSRLWLHWPGGVVTIEADTSMTLEIRDRRGELIYQKDCLGHAAEGTYAAGVVPQSARQRVLTGSITKALANLVTQQLVDAVGRAPNISSDVVLAATNKTPAESAKIPLGPVGNRWAVVVGVTKYKSSGSNLEQLQYADKDAQTFRDFLVSAAGGNFPSNNVLLLTNERATTNELRRGLFSFLKSAIKEDLVVIFFSGHGAADPDRPDNLYLLTYDTDPADVAATAFPMDDVRKALETTIEAQRVVVLADACHSGGVAKNTRTKGVQLGAANEAMNKYWSQLSQTGPGRAIFTSSGRGEVSQESAKWGDGHGVFTWALLDGLKGAADYDRNGIITLGEALRYTDEKVRRETKSAQHPTIAGDQYDPNLPMGVVK